jgi:SAM-dependent methyltransferase
LPYQRKSSRTKPSILRSFLKYIIYQLRLAGWLDAFLFRKARSDNHKANADYFQQEPGIIMPPDYFLYETYQLNYRKFIEDGRLAAAEIAEWTKPYIKTAEPRVLDWGCGVGRLIRHMPELLPGAALYGCDINEQMIECDRTHYTGVSFTTINNFIPVPYAPLFFDLVYGLSVFTHISAGLQADWVAELARILKPDGVLLVTTQGSYYRNKLSPAEKKLLDEKGVYTQSFSRQGHRMMSTYNVSKTFRELFATHFTLLKYHKGPGKIGGQDLWIWQRK